MCSLKLCKMEQKDPTNHLRCRLAFLCFVLMYTVKGLLTVCLSIHNKHVKAEVLVSVIQSLYGSMDITLPELEMFLYKHSGDEFRFTKMHLCHVLYSVFKAIPLPTQ